MLWNTADQNISDLQIQSQIDVLNRDYQLLNSDAINANDPFKGLQADCQIEFCMARRDPNGLSTNGIIRKQTAKTSFSIQNDDAKFSDQGGDDIWDRNSYLNLWVVPQIESNSQSGILGYAQFPGGSALIDGVVVGYKYFGTRGTAEAPFNLGRTATHEIGHWFNLKHIWGANLPAIFSCFDSDGVDDTPNQDDANFGCPSVPKTSCFNGPNGDMFMNFMDYTNDGCMYMFSLGQKDRMFAVIQPGGPRFPLQLSLGCYVPSKPDLVVQNTTVIPSTIPPGGQATITCQNKNKGTSNAAASTTAIWLSKDQVFNKADNGTPADKNLNADMSIPALASGQTSGTFSKQITIPAGTATGTWYIMFGADALNDVPNETDEANNVFVQITVGTDCNAPSITTQPTDKVVTTPNGTSFSVTASGSNNLYRWQSNNGSGWSDVPNSSPYSGTSSQNLNIISTSLSMNGYQYRCVVSSSCTTTTKTSNAATLTVSTSSSGCNNDYSCSAKVLNISSSCFTTSCSTLGATNQSIPFYGGVNCANLYNSSRTDDDVWLSITPTYTSPVTIKVTPTSNLTNFDPSVGLYSGSCSSPIQVSCATAGQVGQSETLIFTPTSGATYLIRIFSYGIGGAYSGNFDICVTAPGQTNPMPDLIITNPQFSANSVCPGATLNISHDVTNNGGALANASTVKYYLSSDNSYSSDDVEIGFTSIASIGSNGAASINRSLTIPAGTSIGSWYILIVADANNDVAEGTNGEGNNVSANSIQITECSGLPDLTIRYNSHTPATITPGTNVYVNFQLNNIGTSNASTDLIGIYLSTDDVFDPATDQLLQEWAKGTPAPGQSYTSDLVCNLPTCTKCGSYYIFLVSDYKNSIAESKEDNNNSSFLIEVTGCVTCSISIPSKGLSFQSAGGTGNVPVTAFYCCPWTATTNDSWITITNALGTGNGAVGYSVSPCNSGGTRTGTIYVNGLSNQITQTCTQACNESQSFVWAAQAGSATLSDASADLALDASGNLYMTGAIQGSSDFGNGIILTTPSTAPDIFVSKHNASGQIVWAVRYGTTSQEVGRGISTDSEGNIYVIGSFGTSITFENITLTSTNGASFLLKLNSGGAVQWAITISDSYASDITIDNSNNIYITGNFTDNSTNYGGLFISKYNTSGAQTWFKTYDVSFHLKAAFAIAYDNMGNLIICGRYMTQLVLGSYILNASNAILDIDAFIAKFDPSGNVLWAKQVTTLGQGQDELRSVAVDKADNIYTIGKVDSTAIVDNITIPLSKNPKAIIIKYDTNGNALWAKASVDGYQYNQSRVIAGSDSYIYFSGNFSRSINMDSVVAIGTGNNDNFIGQMDENGKVKWIKGYGGRQAEENGGFILNNTNDIFVSGGFSSTVAFGGTTLTSAGSTDIFIAKFKQCVPPIANITYSGNSVVCPGQTLTLSTSYCSSNIYQWQLNDVDIPAANNPTYTATQAGSYKVKVSAFEGCGKMSEPVTINSHGVYTFTGNGNWNIASNWSNSAIPPAVLPSCYEIIINPQAGGECILNVPQTIAGGKLTVASGKKLTVQSVLIQ